MTKRRTYRVNADSFRELADILVGTPDEFNADSAFLRGRAEYKPMTGQLYLNTEAVGVFDMYRATGRIDYVIYSYNTPIAYRTCHYIGGEKFWVLPNITISHTSSNHQSKVRAALSLLNVDVKS